MTFTLPIEQFLTTNPDQEIVATGTLTKHNDRTVLNASWYNRRTKAVRISLNDTAPLISHDVALSIFPSIEGKYSENEYTIIGNFYIKSSYGTLNYQGILYTHNDGNIYAMSSTGTMGTGGNSLNIEKDQQLLIRIDV